MQLSYDFEILRSHASPFLLQMWSWFLKNTKEIHKNTLDSHIRITTTKGLQRVMDRVKHGKEEK